MRLTIRCGLIKLTQRKQQLLDREYANLQIVLQGGNAPLYSAHKQQALRFYKKIKKGVQYPLSLRNDLINVQKSKSFYFLRIPVAGQRGGIKVPFKPHRPIPVDAKLCESKLFKRKGKFIANLVYEIPTKLKTHFSSVLAIDMGERTPATAVLLWEGQVMKPMFLGREIRGIRRHHAWLRKRLQERKLLKVVKRIGARERIRVNDILHCVSRHLVDAAVASNSCIALGNLRGIRKGARGRGKRFNRIVSSMPFYKLRSMIEYKAGLLGIPVVAVDERMTSRTCHACGLEGQRKSQGCFVCSNCGQYNADLNGAINIGKRLLPYMDGSGATCGLALNRPDEHPSDGTPEAAPIRTW